MSVKFGRSLKKSSVSKWMPYLEGLSEPCLEHGPRGEKYVDALPSVHLRLESLHGELVAVVVPLAAEVAPLDNDAVAVPGPFI